MWRIGPVSRGTGTVLAASILYLLVLSLITALTSPPLENLRRDVMMTSISPFTRPKPDIVIVAVTEETLASFPYRTPVDRGFLADIITHIQAARPRIIGVDLLFDQPTESDKDGRLQTAIEAAVAPVVVLSASPRDGLTERQVEYLDAFAPSAERGFGALLHDNLDGVVRGALMGRETEGGWDASFAMAIGSVVGVESDRELREMVYYRGPNSEPFKFPLYPAQAIRLVPSNWFANKFVLIGTDLPNEDRHATPFTLLNGPKTGDLPGVVVHAHLIASIISGDKITSLGQIAEIAPFLVAGLLCLWVSWRPMPVALKPMLVGAVLAVIWIGEAYAFAEYAILMSAVAPTLIVIGLSALMGCLAWRREVTERRFIEGAFSKYVSPAVVATIARNPTSVELGGEKRVITSVFTDLENFTPLSARLSPEQLAITLNEYLDTICNLFVEHGATIDKVVGDAVVGFFGAPSIQDDQASRAVALALSVGSLSQQLRVDMARRGVSIGDTRVGVHSGPAIVGNFGGKRFFNYTAVGDTVNIAARLEGANRSIGTRNCMSSAVADKTTGFLFRPIGLLYLKGRPSGIDACEVLNSTMENQALCEEYSKAHALLAAQDGRAATAFEQLAQKHPMDRLILFHRRRIAAGHRGADIYLFDK
ncbi:adenylate/guanylate cyclase domain-containing protein [Mesorhizobium sp.]|uniref:CHASE2 domain-containing protein n=1 Tax=Mesorhizobium sp. TaxID=1871066 RepID=UPI000FE8513D|nr:adenylate/guanylate cyclase domain-containing protein [Mesorhizobium sp.]RWD81320.1 MAG: adenylate/guanylate cyclase domain-containing protein [Mesorhizobium sp.]